MADPLSLAATTAGFISLSINLISAFDTLMRIYKEPLTLKYIRHELMAVNTLVFRMEAIFSSSPVGAPHETTVQWLRDTVDDCRVACETLESQIKTFYPELLSSSTQSQPVPPSPPTTGVPKRRNTLKNKIWHARKGLIRLRQPLRVLRMLEELLDTTLPTLKSRKEDMNIMISLLLWNRVNELSGPADRERQALVHRHFHHHRHSVREILDFEVRAGSANAPHGQPSVPEPLLHITELPAPILQLPGPTIASRYMLSPGTRSMPCLSVPITTPDTSSTTIQPSSSSPHTSTSSQIDAYREKSMGETSLANGHGHIGGSIPSTFRGLKSPVEYHSTRTLENSLMQMLDTVRQDPVPNRSATADSGYESECPSPASFKTAHESFEDLEVSDCMIPGLHELECHSSLPHVPGELPDNPAAPRAVTDDNTFELECPSSAPQRTVSELSGDYMAQRPCAPDGTFELECPSSAPLVRASELPSVPLPQEAPVDGGTFELECPYSAPYNNWTGAHGPYEKRNRSGQPDLNLRGSPNLEITIIGAEAAQQESRPVHAIRYPTEALDNDTIDELLFEGINYEEDLYYAIAAKKGSTDPIRVTLTPEYLTPSMRNILLAWSRNPVRQSFRIAEIPQMTSSPFKNLHYRIIRFEDWTTRLLGDLEELLAGGLVDDPETPVKVVLIRHQVSIMVKIAKDVYRERAAGRPGHDLEDGLILMMNDTLSTLLDLGKECIRWKNGRRGSWVHKDDCIQGRSVPLPKYLIRRASRSLKRRGSTAKQLFGKSICSAPLQCIRTRMISYTLERLKFNKEAFCTLWLFYAPTKEIAGLSLDSDRSLFKRRETLVYCFQSAQDVHLAGIRNRAGTTLADRVEKLYGPFEACQSHTWQDTAGLCQCFQWWRQEDVFA